MNIELPDNLSPYRATLEKYLPVVLVVGIAWLFARGLRKMLWTAFGLYCAFHYSGMGHWH